MALTETSLEPASIQMRADICSTTSNRPSGRKAMPTGAERPSDMSWSVKPSGTRAL